MVSRAAFFGLHAILAFGMSVNVALVVAGPNMMENRSTRNNIKWRGDTLLSQCDDVMDHLKFLCSLIYFSRHKVISTSDFVGIVPKLSNTCKVKSNLWVSRWQPSQIQSPTTQSTNRLKLTASSKLSFNFLPWRHAFPRSNIGDSGHIYINFR